MKRTLFSPLFIVVMVVSGADAFSLFGTGSADNGILGMMISSQVNGSGDLSTAGGQMTGSQDGALGGIGSEHNDGFVKVEPGQATWCFHHDAEIMGQSIHFGWSGTAGMNGMGQHGYIDNENNEGTFDMGDDVECDSDGNEP